MCNIFDPKCGECNLTPETVCRGCCNSWSAWTNSFRLYATTTISIWTTTTTTSDFSSWSACTTNADDFACIDGCGFMLPYNPGCQDKRTQECDNDPGSGCDCDENSLRLETKCCEKKDYVSITSIYVYPI
eukprot:47602_1